MEDGQVPFSWAVGRDTLRRLGVRGQWGGLQEDGSISAMTVLRMSAPLVGNPICHILQPSGARSLLHRIQHLCCTFTYSDPTKYGLDIRVTFPAHTEHSKRPNLQATLSPARIRGHIHMRHGNDAMGAFREPRLAPGSSPASWDGLGSSVGSPGLDPAASAEAELASAEYFLFRLLRRVLRLGNYHG